MTRFATILIEHMVNHGIQHSKSDPNKSIASSKDLANGKESPDGKTQPPGQMAVLEDGGAGYLCAYRERLLLAMKEVNTLKCERDELAAENARLKAASGADASSNGTDKSGSNEGSGKISTAPSETSMPTPTVIFL